MRDFVTFCQVWTDRCSNVNLDAPVYNTYLYCDLVNLIVGDDWLPQAAFYDCLSSTIYINAHMSYPFINLVKS